MDKINLSLIITVVTLLIGLGSTYGMAKNKLEKVDTLEAKVSSHDTRVATMEVSLSNLHEAVQEQKVDTKDLKSDVKEVLRLLMKEANRGT